MMVGYEGHTERLIGLPGQQLVAIVASQHDCIPASLSTVTARRPPEV